MIRDLELSLHLPIAYWEEGHFPNLMCEVPARVVFLVELTNLDKVPSGREVGGPTGWELLPKDWTSVETPDILEFASRFLNPFLSVQQNLSS